MIAAIEARRAAGTNGALTRAQRDHLEALDRAMLIEREARMIMIRQRNARLAAQRAEYGIPVMTAPR